MEHYTGHHGEWKLVPIIPINHDSTVPVRKQSYRLENLSQVNGYQVELDVENEFGKTRFDNLIFCKLTLKTKLFSIFM